MNKLNIFLVLYFTLIFQTIKSDTDTTSTFAPRVQVPTYRIDDRLFPQNSDEEVYYPFPACKPEIFEHDYIDRGGLLISVQNSWRSAKIGQRASLQKICLLPNGVPLTRQCQWHPLTGATWEPIRHWKRIKCIKETREKIITPQLSILQDELQITSNLTKEHRLNITRRMRKMLETEDCEILPADILATTQILTELSNKTEGTELTQDMIGICSALISSDSQTLRISAIELNATNDFLKTFENYMDRLTAQFVPHQRCGIQLTTSIKTNPSEYRNSSSNLRQQNTVETIDFSHLGVVAHLTANVSVFYINPVCAEITGIAVYDTTAFSNIKHTKLFYESHGNFLYRFIYMNESATELMKETGLQVATYLPKNLWQFVKRKMFYEEPNIVLKVYANDALFVVTSNELTCKTSSKIISISIPGFYDEFPETMTLPFFLRNKYFDKSSNKPLPKGTGCGYWNYKTWNYNGVETKSQNFRQDPVIYCQTKHLTQFSFLLGGTYKQTDFGDSILISPAHQHILDIISLVGCSLSLLGLFGIWMTAALFKKWRSIASTKVLLNLCVALTLQMILFVFINTDDMSEQLVRAHTYDKCVALGALLQYSILVVFTWMLIIAFLQFQRYVTVLGIQRPKHYILKSAIAAWGFPLIPTLLVAFIEPASYIPTKYQLRTDTGVCYPSGSGLIFGVVLPVTLICIINLTIFIYVFYSISTTLSQALHRQEKKMAVKQIRLSVLLFFLLGLSWIFGIFAFMHAGIVFSYLFCLTATLQGFVLFLYFVIFDEIPRRAWKELLCNTKHKSITKKSRELQSMTGSTGIESSSHH